jgi:hypothetical protein
MRRRWLNPPGLRRRETRQQRGGEKCRAHFRNVSRHLSQLSCSWKVPQKTETVATNFPQKIRDCIV